MLSRCVVLTLVFSSTMFGQLPNSLPSLPLLQSETVLGSHRERHYSMRMNALGIELSGVVRDEVTDLFRNPAYFASQEEPLLLGELARPYFGKSSGIYSDESPSSFNEFSTPSTGIRLGYASKVGVLLRGDFLSNADSRNDKRESFEEVYSTSIGYTKSFLKSEYENDQWNNDAQVAYGFSIGNNLAAGVSYTLGFDNAPSNSTSLANSFRWLTGYGTDTSWNDYVSKSDGKYKTLSHTLRGGVHYKVNNQTVEGVLTAEILRGDLVGSGSNISTSSHVGRYPLNFNIDSRNYNSTQSSSADVRASNFRLDFRLASTDDESSSFIVQLGGGIAFLSSTDKDSKREFSSSSSFTSFDTTVTAILSNRTTSGSPDGTGWFAQASAGWTFQFDKVLLAVACLGNVQRQSFDYVAISEREDSSYQLSSRRVVRVPYNARRESFAHDVSIFNLTFAVPIGLEVEMLENFFLRTGWSPRFVSFVRKDVSDDNGYRRSQSRLDVSRVTFGIGFEVFGRLKMSMMNLENITRPLDWQVAAQYSL